MAFDNFNLCKGLVPPSPDYPRQVSILGSTGSIGCHTLEVIRRHRSCFKVVALTGGHNIDLLAKQAIEMEAQVVVTIYPHLFPLLKEHLEGTGIQVAAGEEAVIEAASYPCDWVMASICGMAGLKPSLAAVKQAKVVALANKESVVSAGKYIFEEAKKNGTCLLPVDSEHNALFQILQGTTLRGLERLTITASGGPFRCFTKEAMATVTVEQAMAHPNWKMGPKNSIDSATLVNKGLELIEAHYFFDIPSACIDILVHPQSVIHAIAQFYDGSMLAQMSLPNMQTAISFTLGWPERLSTSVDPIDLKKIGALTFEEVDEARFSGIKLARQALQLGEGATIVFNAANEVAVEHFMEKRIGFNQICEAIEVTLSTYEGASIVNIEDVFAIDNEARQVARTVCKQV